MSAAAKLVFTLNSVLHSPPFHSTTALHAVFPKSSQEEFKASFPIAFTLLFPATPVPCYAHGGLLRGVGAGCNAKCGLV